jgi:hypothetical protein
MLRQWRLPPDVFLLAFGFLVAISALAVVNVPVQKSSPPTCRSLSCDLQVSVLRQFKKADQRLASLQVAARKSGNLITIIGRTESPRESRQIYAQLAYMRALAMAIRGLDQGRLTYRNLGTLHTGGTVLFTVNVEDLGSKHSALRLRFG